MAVKKKRQPKEKQLTEKEKKELMRQKVLNLIDQGLSTPEICKKLEVAPGSVMAWRAHHTMGTYKKVR